MQIPSYQKIQEKKHLIYDQLACCNLCPHRCGVNRQAGQTGFCGVDAQGYCFREMMSQSEEVDLSPSHQIYYTGCNLRCGFCTVAEWNRHPMVIPPIDPIRLREQIAKRQAEGSVNVNFLGGEPAVNVHAILDLLGQVPAKTCVVWNSNMYYGEPVHSAIEGLVDIYLADYKCGNNLCAEVMLGVRDYLDTIQTNLIRASCLSTLIVRHVVLPGHLECCTAPLLEWIAQQIPTIKVSLRWDYVPPVPAGRCPSNYLMENDKKRALQIAKQLKINMI